MSMASHKHSFGETIDAAGSYVSELMKIAFFTILNAALASATAVHAAITCSGTLVTTVTTDITNPDVARVVSATAGGTAGDIKAVRVTITGKNMADETITEVLPVFTVDTPGTVTGAKAFKTVDSISIPAMDGAGATVSIGRGAALGLPYKLKYAGQVEKAWFAGAAETISAQTVSATAVEGNTITTTTALDGAKDLELKICVK